MRRPLVQTLSLASGLRRALELWPYIFVVISVAGLAYIALKTAR